MTAEEYEILFGAAPVNDDLDRFMCPEAGHVGHKGCGVCMTCKRPAWQCGHDGVPVVEG